MVLAVAFVKSCPILVTALPMLVISACVKIFPDVAAFTMSSSGLVLTPACEKTCALLTSGFVVVPSKNVLTASTLI